MVNCEEKYHLDIYEKNGPRPFKKNKELANCVEINMCNNNNSAALNLSKKMEKEPKFDNYL